MSRVKTNGNVVSGKPSLKLTYHFHCHLLRLPVMPYWQILPLPAMPCLQQEQVCYQHLLLSPLPPHIILHQQTADGSKQIVRRPINSFYRSNFSCFASQDGDVKVQVPVWPGLVVISWEEQEEEEDRGPPPRLVATMRRRALLQPENSNVRIVLRTIVQSK